MKKYISPLTATLTPDNWQEKLNPNDMTMDELLDLFGDLKSMEAFSKKLGGYVKQVIGVRMPEDEDEYVGTHFMITRNFRERAGGLNKDLILEEMGEDWVQEHSKEPTEYVEFRLAPVKEE